MNHIQLPIFKDFVSPPPDNISLLQTYKDLMGHFLTLGLRSAFQQVHHQYRLYELEEERKELLNDVSQLTIHWNSLEELVIKRMEEFAMSQPASVVESEEPENKLVADDWQEKMQQLVKDKEEIEKNSLASNKDSESPSLFLTSLVILSFVINVFANFSFMNVQSFYKNYSFKQRIKILEAQNQYLKDQIARLSETYETSFQTQMECLKNGWDAKRDLLHIQGTETAKTYLEAADLKKQLQKVQIQQQQMQKDFDHLQAQYAIAKEAERQLGKLKQTLNNHPSNLENDFKNAGVESLSQEVKQLNEQANRLQSLDQQLEGALTDSALQLLLKRVGPLAPRYQFSRDEVDRVEGAAGIEDYNEEEKFDWDSYARRYNGIRLAPELFRVGFAYALATLFSLANKQGDMIKLNRSLGTSMSKGAQAVYRFLALDWIKGGRPVSNCHGYYEFHLNNKEVKMLPSTPENVLKYRNDKGTLQPIITLHFQHRDDFTPAEEELVHTSAARGIDPLAAKCLLAKLSETEMHHLKVLLLEMVIEDSHPAYQKTVDFMCRQSEEKRQKMFILRDLISDMGIVLEQKFKQTIAMAEWKKYLDLDNDTLEPFIKLNKEESVVIPPETKSEPQELFLPWELDVKTLALIKEEGVIQEDFLVLIAEAQSKYQIYFNQLKPQLLQHPMRVGATIKFVTWDHIQDQYYVAHEFIGNQKCLFSNLFTALMTNEKEATEENILKLKASMADYLDDPQHAEQFRGAIRNDCNCSVEEYQQWLRGNQEIGIKENELTPLQIEIAAYTLGVRFALFTPPTSTEDHACTKGVVDKYGRLVPAEDIPGHYFGPHTREVFFMAIKNNYSYYALFPKFTLKECSPPEDISLLKWTELINLHQYWQDLHVDENF